ncbi:MAG: response regulator transcription factor [Actinomycetota bacterium]|nr:response regulator transcription factor [Actinomycetota bacterium]
MRIYLLCDPERERFFRDILEDDFDLSSLMDEDTPRLVAGELVLADFTARRGAWKEKLFSLRRNLPEEVLVIAVLRPEQIENLGYGDPLDDFMIEGSTLEEMRARLRMLVKEREDRPGVMRFGELTIDVERYEVKVSGRPVELTFKEFELLRYLAARPGRVFTREILLEQVWGYDYYGGSRTVDVHIRRIRSKTEWEGHTYIRTIRGVGYVFEHQPPE